MECGKRTNNKREWKVERNRTQNTEQVMLAVPENATCEVCNEYVKKKNT